MRPVVLRLRIASELSASFGSHRISIYSLPADSEDNDGRNVQDVTIIANTAIIGYGFNGDNHRPSQISLIPPIRPVCLYRR